VMLTGIFILHLYAFEVQWDIWPKNILYYFSELQIQISKQKKIIKILFPEVQ
jgi:hypothetical protein